MTFSETRNQLVSLQTESDSIEVQLATLLARRGDVAKAIADLKGGLFDRFAAQLGTANSFATAGAAMDAE